MVAAALVPFEIASGLAVVLLLLLPIELQLFALSMCNEASGGGEGGSWAGTRCWPDAEITASEAGWHRQAGAGAVGSSITRVLSPWPTSLFGTAFSSCLLTLPAPGPPIQILDYRPFTPPLSLCLRGCAPLASSSRALPRLSLSSRSSSPFEIISIRNLDDCFALGPSLVPGRMFCNLISLSLFFSPRLETLQRARQSTMLEQSSSPLRSVPRSPRRIVLKYDPVRRTTTSSRSNRLQSSCGRYGTYDDKDGRAVTRYFCLLSNSYTHATHG